MDPELREGILEDDLEVKVEHWGNQPKQYKAERTRKGRPGPAFSLISCA